MKGFHNRVLTVDLTHGKWEGTPIPGDTLRSTLGGKGLATHLLLRYNPPGVDPLGPENRLIFAIGPVTGTSVWGSCRHGVFCKSPLTGFYSESYAGGTVAETMDGAGFDALMIHGASREPVWIEVSPEGVQFHPAQDLWGLDTYETEDRVKSWVRENRPHAKKTGVVCIGPAGENRVAFAVIENDYWRSAGRTGVGAVMGSKKIKAVAFWGDRKRSVADPALLKRFSAEVAERAKTDKGVAAYKSLGTPMMVDVMSSVGSFPTRYWHRGQAAHREGINAAALHERLKVNPHACLKCFVACGRLATVKEGRHKGLKIEGPEYETIYAFGGLCEVDRIEEIAFLNDLCDRLGLDTMSAGNLAALTIEAVAQGRVGYDVQYGHVDKIARLLEDMAYRRDIGETLAQGIKKAAREWGMEDQAIHVKGLEPAGYDPRVLKGMGLAYGTSDRGACHMRATFYKPELAGMVDPDAIEGKAAVFVEWEDRLTFFDALMLCRFYRDLYQWDSLATMLRGSTGLDLGVEDMKTIARRITDETRTFNLREALRPADDHLPKRFYTEALPETGKSISEAQMAQLLKDYYRVRGWDEQGKPKGYG
jgi:aldehyde:ferredoxin oxidoreductase